jgi:dCMP deaminase
MDVKYMSKIRKYHQLAITNAELFSKDPAKKVGTLLMRDDLSSILATGINGFPAHVHENEKRWERSAKSEFVTHSEINAICNAARAGTSTEGAIAIVTLYPCRECSKALIQAGIKKIFAPKPDFQHERWGESFATSREMLKEAGVDIFEIESEVNT